MIPAQRPPASGDDSQATAETATYLPQDQQADWHLDLDDDVLIALACRTVQPGTNRSADKR